MKIGIIGATGAVGKVFLNLLPNSTLEISDLKLTASKRSIGKKINYENKEYTIQEHNDDFYNDLDYVFSSASSEVSKIEWVNYEKCLYNIRSYNLEKKRLITNIHNMINKFNLMYL